MTYYFSDIGLRNIPDLFKKIVIVNGAKKPWRNENGFEF